MIIKILLLLLLSAYSLLADVYATHAMSTNGHNMYKVTPSSVSTPTNFFAPGGFFKGLAGYYDYNNYFAFSGNNSVTLAGSSIPNYYTNYPISGHGMLYNSSDVVIDEDFMLKETKDSLIMFFASTVGTTNITVRPLGACVNFDNAVKSAEGQSFFPSSINKRTFINITSLRGWGDFSAFCFSFDDTYSALHASSFLKTEFDANSTFTYLYKKMFFQDAYRIDNFAAACANNTYSCSLKLSFNENACKQQIVPSYPEYFSIQNNYSKFIPITQSCDQFNGSIFSYKDRSYKILRTDVKNGIDNCRACLFNFTNSYVELANQCTVAHDVANKNCADLKKGGVAKNFTCSFVDNTLVQDYRCDFEFLIGDIVKNPDGTYTINGEDGGYKDTATGKIYTKDGKYTGFVELPDGRIVREGSPDDVLSDIEDSVSDEIDKVIDDLTEEDPILGEITFLLKKSYDYVKDSYSYESVLSRMKIYEQSDYDFNVGFYFRDQYYDLFSKWKIEQFAGDTIDLLRRALIFVAYSLSLFILFRR